MALLAIFVVHADLGLAPGGFLAVSTFFTLSGFLITTLLVREHSSAGRIDLVAFWVRRARRLLPIALLGIVTIAAATIVFGDSHQVANLRGDVTGALLYVANWRFLFADVSYAGTFAGQSPLLHYWSLAIEEQFYLLFPVVAMAALALGSVRHWATSAFLAAGIAASVAIGIVASADVVGPDRLYFRTDIRMGELLVGALAGLWWTRRGHALPGRVSRWVRLSGPVALVAMIALISTSDYRDIGWYRGGLVAYSLVSVLVVLAAVEPAGPVRRFLALPPLVRVGMSSYSSYVIHWPLFMWLATRTEMSGAARLLVGTVATLVLSELAHRYVESPLRHGRDGRHMRPWKLVGGGVVISVLAVVVAVAAPHLALRDEEALEQAADTMEEHLEITAAAEGEAPTVGLFGDSTALVLSSGIAIFDDDDATIRLGAGWAGLGCSVTAPASYVYEGTPMNSPEACSEWLDFWALASTTGNLDVAVLHFGPWDVKEMKPEGHDGFAVIGSPEIDQVIEDRVSAGIETLARDTPVIVLLTSPYIEPGRVDGRSPANQQVDADPARMDRLNEILTEVASRYPQVAVIDFAAWLQATGEDERMRPDGVHLTEESAIEVAAPLAATLVEILAVADGEPASTDEELMPVLSQAVADP